MGKVLAIFYLQIIPMLSTKFQVNWPFGSGEEAKNRFSSWQPLWPSWISDRKDFSYVCSSSHLNASYQVGCHLGFPMGKVLAIFDLQIIPMLSTKFQVNWPFGSGEEAKNIFSSWWPLWPSWISDRKDFSYVCSSSHLNASYQVSSLLAQGYRRSRLLKQIVDTVRSTMDNGHWLITTAHLEHFMLRWAKNITKW